MLLTVFARRNILISNLLNLGLFFLDYFVAFRLVGDGCHEKSTGGSFAAETFVVVLFDYVVFEYCASFAGDEILDVVDLGLDVWRLLSHDLLLQCVPE